ncbi:12116_t:CDS:1, partial [Entrophospora sp. SA101]
FNHSNTHKQNYHEVYINSSCSRRHNFQRLYRHLGRKRDAPLLSTWKEGIVVTSANSSSLKKQGGDCPNGFSPCQNGGCCPNGQICTGNNQCSGSCQSSDPVCGNGCCRSDEICCSGTVNFCCLAGQTCGGSDYECNTQSFPTDSSIPTATPT